MTGIKKRLGLLLLPALMASSATLSAQTGEEGLLHTLQLETRADYDYKTFSPAGEDRGGFSGKFLNLIIKGDITDKFSYSYRQRILPHKGNKTFFDGTDWLYLNYKINRNFSLTAGKQVFSIGGFEYDLAPIDVYYWSDFWNNIRCYQLGFSAAYTDNSGRNTLSLQVANSNYTDETLSNLYAYNLIWYGNYEHWKSIWSVNLVERSRGSYISYIALGNKFVFDGFSFYVDFMNRATKHQKNFLFDDFTLIGRADWRINKQWNVFAKGGYDTNKAQLGGLSAPAAHDVFVLPGTEYSYGGAGVEFYPLKDSEKIRLHAFCAYKNMQKTDDIARTTSREEELHAALGLTWRIDVLGGMKKFLKR